MKWFCELRRISKYWLGVLLLSFVPAIFADAQEVDFFDGRATVMVVNLESGEVLSKLKTYGNELVALDDEPFLLKRTRSGLEVYVQRNLDLDPDRLIKISGIGQESYAGTGQGRERYYYLIGGIRGQPNCLKFSKVHFARDRRIWAWTSTGDLYVFDELAADLQFVFPAGVRIGLLAENKFLIAYPSGAIWVCGEDGDPIYKVRDAGERYGGFAFSLPYYSNGLLHLNMSEDLYLNELGEIVFSGGKGCMGEPFSEGLAKTLDLSAKPWRRRGFRGLDGQWAIKPGYADVSHFRNDLAYATLVDSYEKDAKYGFIDQSENWVIEPIYDEAEMFDLELGLARVRKGEKWGMINKKGEVVIPFEYKHISTIKKGFCIALPHDFETIYDYRVLDLRDTKPLK